MITATTVVGIDVSRDWLDGFCFPSEQRFRVANSAEGHELLVAAVREMTGPVKIGFEATGGQEWVLWATLVAAEIDAAQLPPAQIKAFALSRGTRAKTDRIDAEMIARFMQFRPDAGRGLPTENLRILRTLTTRRAQIVDMCKRLSAQIAARRKQDVPADVDGMDADLRAMLDTQISELERRIESVAALPIFAELVVADPEPARSATGGGSDIEIVVGDVLIRAGAGADEGQPTVTTRRVLQPLLKEDDPAGFRSMKSGRVVHGESKILFNSG